jgi:hypothetical protein
VGNALAGTELLLSLVNISKKLELFDQFLVRRHVHENGCASAVLGEKHGAPPALDLPHDACNVGAELGERANVFARSRLRHASRPCCTEVWKTSAPVQRLAARLPARGEPEALNSTPDRAGGFDTWTDGFLFSGLAPRFVAGGDVQCVASDLDPARLE